MRTHAILALASTAVLVAEDNDFKRVNLPKLLDRATRDAEVETLLAKDQDSSVHRTLRDYRLVACPQDGNQETLHTLLIASDYVFESSIPGRGAYPVERPEELFPPATPALRAAASLAPPGLERLDDYWLIVFTPDGREIRPFGGNNVLSSGYLADFNGDGIIDRLDTTNYGVDDKLAVRVLELASVERKSRILLNVLYDWHPEKVDDDNAWDYECFDDDKDGLIEIGFGPKDAEHKREIVFRWDKGKSAYTAPNLDNQKRIRVLANSEPWKELKKIQSAGGHRYPLVAAKPAKPADPGQPATPPALFRFESLKGRSDEEIARFMSGAAAPDSFHPADAPDTTLPNNFWTTDPQAAALTFVEANRSAAHRKAFRLAIDDRNGVKPPDAGWLVHDSGSAACYTFRSALTVVRFGVGQPFLFHAATSSNGVVGANQLADRTGHALRLIPLSADEARFLANSVFWLDRVRSQSIRHDRSFGGMSSSADGFGTLDWFPAKQAPRRLQGTLWSTSSLASRWHGDDYEEGTCLNFSDFLLTEALPKHLGQRWNTGTDLDHRNLTTPLTDRLKPREDSDTRDQLADVILTALKRHLADPWPAAPLVAMAGCAGETGLSQTLPALQQLATTLPPAMPEETEFRELERKFDRVYEAPKDAQGRKQWDRHQALREKFKHDIPCQLREPLARALQQLRAIDDPARLIDMAKADGATAVWALQQLQLHHPEAYADVLIARFRDADNDGRRTIFETLATAHPPGAKRLRATLTPKQQADLAIELAGFESKDEPDLAKTRIPALIEILKDSSGLRDWRDRGPAIERLANLPLDDAQRGQFEALLFAELKMPRRDDVRISVLSSVMQALLKLPEPDRHWDSLVRSSSKAKDFGEFGSLLDALATLAGAKPEPRMGQLADFLKPRFTRHGGMMNDLFLAALALDLRTLAPEIERLASTGPDVPDGEGANSWGGNFTGPGNHRYHTARHVTALWQEADPDTRAKMWGALFAENPHEFRGDSAIATALRERFRSTLSAASPQVREPVIARARKAAEAYPDLTNWIEGLKADHSKE